MCDYKLKLEDILERIPPAFYGKNEKELVIHLNLVLAYMDFILKNQAELLKDPFFIDKIINVLVILMKLKLKNQTLDSRGIESLSLVDDLNLTQEQVYEYESIRDEKIQKLVLSVCNTISSDILFKDTVDVLFDYTTTNHLNEITLIFIHLFKNKQTISGEYIEQCVDEYLDDKHWYIETSSSDPNVTANIIHLSLTMEFLAILLKQNYSGNDIFEKRLYLKLFEKLDNSNCYVSKSALNTIKTISYHESFQIYARSLLPRIIALGKLNRNRSFLVLNVILQFLDTNTDSTLIFEIIERGVRFIADADDRVKYDLIKTLYLALIKISTVDSKPSDTYKKLNRTELLQNWTKFGNDSEESNKTESSDVDEEEQEPNKEESLSNKVFENVILNLTDVISSSNPDLKVLTMRTVTLCFKELEHDSEILPAVHKIWPYMIVNLKNQTDNVLNETYDLLLTIMKRCKRFVEQRLTSEVLPSLLASVKLQSEKLSQISK